MKNPDVPVGVGDRSRYNAFMSREELTHIRLGNGETNVFFAAVDDLAGPIMAADVMGRDQNPPSVLICDANTAKMNIPLAPNMRRIVVPPGERCKQADVLLSVIEGLVDFGLTRESAVFALGGGAVTDLGAFVASIYLRGISCVLLPTSLLAMVDAAVGGKTGIDFGGYKNMVGTFAPAREVRIAPDVLDTLPRREYVSGLAEVIKAGFLGDGELVAFLEDRAPDVLERDPAAVREIIARAVKYKAAVVEADFTEQGERAFLNLGHTFGHALEASLGLGEWTHGEAVAWGIARAMHAGASLGITDPSWTERVIALLERYEYETGPAPVEPRKIVDGMYKDKKRNSRGITFVLQRGPQDTVLQTLEPKQILDILVM